VYRFRTSSIPVFFGLVATVAGLHADALTVQGRDVLHLVAAVNDAESRRGSDVTTITSMRRYVLKNKRWDKDAVMYVRVTEHVGEGKKFDMVRMENADGLQKRVFMKLLEGEVEAAKHDVEADSALTSSNYDFTVVGSETLQGRQCVVLDLTPKRHTKYLLVGKVWIDPKEQAVLRVEGQTARSLSFWIGKPQIRQDFRKVQDIWLSAANRSVSDVKLIGRTELVIDYLEYEIGRERGADIAQRVQKPAANVR